MVYNPTMTCPKCNVAMEEGFLAGPRLVEWIEGVLVQEKSALFEIKPRDRKHLRIRTLRCLKCGFLESYASSDNQPTAT